MLKALDLKEDIIASVVVFLVAMPLCLGIALACGVPLFSGILTGVIGGIVVGVLSESSISVSGPAAGMVAVVIAGIATLGSFHAFLLALFFAGLLQILIGIFRAGFIAAYIPITVIQGLLAAIGILIVIKQLPLAFGYLSQNGVFEQSLEIAQENLSVVPFISLVHHLNLGASIISIISLIILLAWTYLPFRFFRVVPSAIVVVVVSVMINESFILFFPTLALQNLHLVNIPISEGLHSFVGQFQRPTFSDWENYQVYVYAFTIALVASLETLLNLEAAEKVHKHGRQASRSRELIAQGVGNSLSGLMGGLPVTSVVIRSTVNIHSGAKSKLSTILHGFFLLFALTVVPEWLNRIPIAALAAILIYTGYKLARISLFREMYDKGWICFFPFVVTVLAIVFTNLLLGVLIGLGVSAFFILQQSARKRFMTVNELHASGEVLRLVLPHQLTFLNKASMLETLNSIKKNQKIILDASATDYIDEDMLEIIKEFKDNQAVEKNIALNFEGFKDHYELGKKINFITVTTYDVQSQLTPIDVLNILQEGNQRFVNNTLIHKNYPQQIQATLKSQHPLAVVLSCIDSRVPIELIFDLSLGDAFVIRIAGNVLNEDIIGSLEFACYEAGAKLILVLGHEQCGAIKAACDHVQLGHLTHLLEKISPAIEEETQTVENRTSSNDQFVSNVMLNHIDLVKEQVYESSDILRKLINSGTVGLTAGFYDIATGKITFNLDSAVDSYYERLIQ